MSKYKKYTITLPKDTVREYKKFLESIGMNMSSRIAILIKKDIKRVKGLKKGLVNGL